MRQIKFRVWIPSIKQMRGDSDAKKFLSINADSSCNAGGDNIYMQFTGLKDKNGKEIYHKDQFKVNHKVYTVEWNDEYLAWEVTWVDIFKDNKENIELPRRSMLKHFFDDNPSAVVIGNIYENPELLSPQ